ncbi:MAG: polysaccharide biosynthesis/export family protein [Cyclobacteriaceae bacterium]|nr:polysaccharide biosynthesis/export family protein [Cyclobacteriaceae bacterium]
MTRILVLFAGAVLLFSSCVTNKKYVYLQKNDVNARAGQLPKDSVVRTYPQQSFEYLIQPNDALYIRFESLTPEDYNFFKEVEAQSAGGGNRNFAITSELVDQDGMVLFPVVGKVKVSGLTVFQAQDSLQKIANLYLESPVVKVRLVNFRYTVIGEVKKEGTVISYDNRVSLPEAIGLAGGIDDLADRANVKIIRQRNGQMEVGYINLLDENMIQSPFYYVYQNDIIVVPALRQRPYRKYFGQNLSLVISSLSLLLLVYSITTN